MWDIGFSAGSILSSLLIGVAMGNIAWGVPIDARGEFAGTFLGLLSPYPLLVGVTTVSLFMMHGALYASMKTEGPLRDKLRGWIINCMIFFIICYAVTTMATLLYVPHMAARVRANPWLFSWRWRTCWRSPTSRARFTAAATGGHFLMSSRSGDVPNCVEQSEPGAQPESQCRFPTKTLGIMLTIAAIGVPVVLAYIEHLDLPGQGEAPDELLA
jgi:cytochrome d ubiquinol oxidase subunit II